MWSSNAQVGVGAHIDICELETAHCPHELLFITCCRSYSSYRYFKKEKLEQTKALGISNSIMFSAGALLQQGYERYPKSLSGEKMALLVT